MATKRTRVPEKIAFTSLGGESRSYIGRLNADGSLDLNFDPGADERVHSLVVQPDGKILVAGSFKTLGGQELGERGLHRLGRLTNPDAATQQLSVEDSRLVWMRGGSSPEVWRTTFEYSIDGVEWTMLGPGRRIAGGWELNGAMFPFDGMVRARGYVAGDSRGSNWFVEATLPVERSFGFLRENLGFSDGRFGFQFTGPEGQTVVIEASSDVRTWIPVWTNTFESGPLFWEDPDSSTLPLRFYRLRD